MTRALSYFSGITLLLFLGSCGPPHYSLLKPNRVTVAEKYSVLPKYDMNQKTTPKGFFWTVDGADLDRIIFLNSIGDGETLFGNDSKVVFRSEMNVIEISEIFYNSFKTVGGFGKMELKSINKNPFGPFEGFSFGMELTNEDGLKYRGKASGAVIDEKLYMIIFLATEYYYYPKYIGDFDNLIASIQKI